jgi:cysteine desulfurase / selenocysteine lyase
MFDKSNARFPIKDRYIFLSHCGVSPLHGAAMRKELEIAEEQTRMASLLFEKYDVVLGGLRKSAGRLLRTSERNVAFVRNTSEGINLIADGYPFERDDVVITYKNEYPANYYPWKLQEKRGRAKLVELPNRGAATSDAQGPPVAWTLDDLRDRLKENERTRVVALSHVQFASGYCADLQALADLCRAHEVDLVLDVAQSLGCLPVYPEQLGVAAVVSSGWKWLMGPIGTGLIYTSEQFREKLNLVMVGAGTMKQGTDYLDHTWEPHDCSKVFEYSTAPLSLAAALECCIRELALDRPIEDVAAEIWRLQDVFLREIDRDMFRPIFAGTEQRSSILSLAVPVDPDVLQQELRNERVICTARGGYLRIAPHFYNTDDQLEQAAHLLNRIAREKLGV